MKAISLWQPWASLIACGAKPFETRHWAPPRNLIGQRIAIHAAKKIDKEAAEFAGELLTGSYGFVLQDKLHATIAGVPSTMMAAFRQIQMPVGCVLCTVTLDAALQLGEEAEGTALPAARVVNCLVSRQMPECFTVRYDDFGDYAPGRWAWLLRDVKLLTRPLPMHGAQGFFNLPDDFGQS